jgi:hypothetical protein
MTMRIELVCHATPSRRDSTLIRSSRDASQVTTRERNAAIWATVNHGGARFHFPRAARSRTSVFVVMLQSPAWQPCGAHFFPFRDHLTEDVQAR